jgi:hypothetical protein
LAFEWGLVMKMKFVGWAAALAMVGAALSVGRVDAAVQILSGSGGPNPSENVLFTNNPVDGLTVQGITNLTSALVDFTGLETLHATGGQAKLGAVDGDFSQVSWKLDTPNTGYENLKFNILFPDNESTLGPDAGTITIDVLNQFGVHTIFVDSLSSAGNNFFQVHTTNGDLITQVTLTGTPWTTLEDVRIGDDPPISAVPELSTWTMMLIGFGGLGLVAYRRTRKLTALPSIS